MRHLMSPMDLSVEELAKVLDLANDIEKNPEKYAHKCEGKILATLFYEPSTRTRLSFESAMLRLGGKVLGFSSADSSSAAKGESVADTIRVVSGYADICAMRHPKEGAPLVASMASQIPVINAGDGGHQHPTQTLTDLLTIRSMKGRLDHITIGLCGDLKFGRTVHSLIEALVRYEGVKFVLISPEELRIPDYIRDDVLKASGHEFTEVERLEEALPQLDLLYMTRVQKERFFNEEDYVRMKDFYILDKAKMEGLPSVPSQVNFILGGRSFSIYEVTADGLLQVFDSGSDFENITAAAYPDYFNASNKNNKLDSRSDAKGPEPESIAVAKAGDKTYAYIGLERIGGIMLYDITNPADAFFCDYINSRDFTVDFPESGTDPLQGDVSVEGICAVPAEHSPTGYPLLLAANEVSGTVAVYQQKEGYVAPEPDSGSSGSSATYPVTVEESSNGSITLTPKNAHRGDTVTVTVTPDDGYKLDALIVTDKDGNTVPVTEKNGKYTFRMPASKVTVRASFVVDAAVVNFVDVPADAYYHDAVLWAVEKGITNGTDTTHFSPDFSCTRAQMVTFLWRASGSPGPKSDAMPFTDVKADSYYYDAVIWATENGITNGISDTTFSPDDICTRAQMVSFLYRMADSPEVSGSTTFTDVAADAYYAKAVEWAKMNNITNGIGGGLFGPDYDCTRAQIVTFLWRALAE